MNKIRKVLNKIAIYIIIFFIAISILQILGVLACAIPKKMLNNNKIETARQFLVIVVSSTRKSFSTL